MNNTQIAGVVMCGGKGSRFIAPYDIQKCIYKMGETSSIELVIEKFIELSIAPIYFLTGHDAEATEEFIKSITYDRVNTIFVRDQTTTGTAWSIINAIDTLPEQFIYHHGNLLLHDIIYRDLLQSIHGENITKLVVQDYTNSLTHPVLKITNGFVEIKRKPISPYSDWKSISGVSYIKKESVIRENILPDIETTEELLTGQLTEKNLLKNKYPIYHLESLEDIKKFEKLIYVK